MATEELIVLFDAKTSDLDRKLNGTNDKLDKLDGSTKKADKSFLSFGKAGSIAATGITALATAALAVNAAISAMVLSSANNRRELELLSTQAKTSTEDFQALAFATQTYGINAEQIADISKDISDRVGEFSAAGTGTFQDYADVLKLTKEEARQTAIEFQGLSSQEVIGRMVSEMEKANVSGDQMTFVLESMGNDLSRLKPLFADNSAELGTLKDRFNDVNSSLSITAGQAEGLQEVSTSYTLMTSQLGNAATAISATIAPVMDDFFNDVISIVPEATQTIIDFANSFLDAENISSQAGVLKEIAASQSRLVELENRLAEAKERTNNSGSGLVNTSELQIESAKVLIEQEKTRTAELNAQLEVLEDQQIRLENAESLKGGEIGGLAGVDGEVSGLGTGDEIQAIADRFKTEEELLVEKLEREREIIGDDKLLRLELEDEFIENMIAIDERYAEEKARAKEDEKKQAEKIQKEKDKQARLDEKALSKKNKDEQKFADDSVNLALMVFGENKAISATAAFINTAEGVTKALSKQDYAGAALTAATGAVQISSILSSSPGTTGSTGSIGSSSSQTQEDSFTQDVGSDLEIRESTSSGTTQARISFADDSGDDIIDAIAKALNKGQSEGRYV